MRRLLCSRGSLGWLGCAAPAPRRGEALGAATLSLSLPTIGRTPLAMDGHGPDLAMVSALPCDARLGMEVWSAAPELRSPLLRAHGSRLGKAIRPRSFSPTLLLPCEWNGLAMAVLWPWRARPCGCPWWRRFGALAARQARVCSRAVLMRACVRACVQRCCLGPWLGDCASMATA